MPLKRRSAHLSRLLHELKQAALQMEDEELRAKLWRWYYKALHAEDEVRAMVMDAEMRRLLDFVFPNGLPVLFQDGTIQQPQDIDLDTLSDEDIPPIQKRLWDE